MARELQDVMSSGEITDIKLNGTGPDNALVESAEITTRIQSAMQSAMLWQGVHTREATYQKNAVVRQGQWLMIANKETDDEPAPAITGAPFYQIDDPLAGVATSAKVLTLGNRYVAEADEWLVGYRVDVTAGNTYEVIYVLDPLGAAEAHLMNIFTANEAGWRDFGVVPTPLVLGTTFDLLVHITQPDPTPTTFSGNWDYKRKSGTPGSGEYYQDGNGNVSISNTDNDSNNQSTNLATLGVGDRIKGGGMEWAIQEITTSAGHTDMKVSPVTRISEGVVNLTFQHTPVATLSGGKITDYWPTSIHPDNKGLYVADGGYTDVVEDDSAYGTDILIQNAYVSPDWDILSYSKI